MPGLNMWTRPPGMASLMSLLSLVLNRSFIFKPDFPGLAALCNFVVSLWQDRGYAQLKPVRFPPLLTGTCMGRGAYDVQSVFQFAPGFLSSGPFHISQVHACNLRIFSGLSQVYAPPLSSNMFTPNGTAVPGSLSSPLALPYTSSENPHPQKTSLHITHHSKELTLFKLKSVCPASLLAEPCLFKQARTQWGEMGRAPIKNATDFHFSHSKFNGTPSKVSCNWPLVSLQSTEMAALEKQCGNKIVFKCLHSLNQQSQF